MMKVQQLYFGSLIPWPSKFEIPPTQTIFKGKFTRTISSYHFALHCTFYLSVNVFSTKVLIGNTIFTSPNGDETAILRRHPSHAKVSPLAVQRNYLHFSVILRPWVMVRPRESNLRPPALQSNALPTDPICILSSINWSQYTLFVCRSFQIQT